MEKLMRYGKETVKVIDDTPGKHLVQVTRTDEHSAFWVLREKLTRIEDKKAK